jgi:hypothetical protein
MLAMHRAVTFPTIISGFSATINTAVTGTVVMIHSVTMLSLKTSTAL